MDLFTWAEQMASRPIAPVLQNPFARPAEDVPDEFWAIVHLMHSRIGKDLALTALEIADATELRPDGTPGSRSRHVRHLLEVHFEDLPYVLCADSTGYYRPADTDELSHYHANLRARAVAIFQRLSTFKRLARIAGYHYAGKTRWVREP